MQKDDSIRFVDQGQPSSSGATPEELSEALKNTETRKEALEALRQRSASEYFLTRAAAEISASRMIDNGDIQFSEAESPDE